MTTADDSGRPARVGAEALHEQGCGRPLGHYTILRRLAEGGMAEVYLARAPASSGFAAPVAIKKILPQFSNNARFTEMLKDEAKIAVSLTHTNIAQVYELGLAGDDYFIVMEYVQGRPLSKLMRRMDDEDHTAIPIPHAVHIMSEVAKGLDHAHRQTDARGVRRNIVHRDVSPQNILIAYSGEVKLIDFGIARAESRVHESNQGVIKGKLRYLAPEIAAGVEPDHRADIFCSGIVLFEMLTGEAMFAPKSDAEAIEIATRAEVKSPRSRNPLVPRALDAIVMRALRKDREERYASARDMFLDLTRFLRGFAPGYSGGELAGLMRSMFRPDIVLERSLNEAAIALVESRSAPEGAWALSAEDAVEPTYKQLVTRFEIAPDDVTDADAAPAVLVDGAVSEDRGQADEGSDRADATGAKRPVGKAASRSAGVANARLAPGPTGDIEAREAEARAVGLASDTDQAIGAESRAFGGEATDTTPVTGGTPIGDERTAPPTLVDEAVAMNPLTVELTGSNAAVARADRVRLAQRGAAALGVVAVVALGWLSIRASDDRTLNAGVAQPIGNVANKSDPVLTVVSNPRVPLTVWLDDEIHVRDALRPVVLASLAPNERHRLRIGADGYREISVVRTLKPGERRTIEVTLVPATGTIRIQNAEGLVRPSVGRVDGDRVVGIPLNTRVRLWIERPGAPPFRHEVEVTSAEEVQVVVPRARRRGTLTVTAEPVSTVYIEGKKKGRTPLSVRLPAGSYQITLEGPSGKTEEITRSVPAGQTTTLEYRWPR